MKQFKFSVLFVSMICILIGYFEPANAAVISKSITKKFNISSPAYAILNTTSDVCPFFPNPISPNQAILTVSASGNSVVSATVTYTGGGIIESNPQLEPIIESNPQFPIDGMKGYFTEGATLIGSSITFKGPIPVGNYVMIVKTSNGSLYTVKFSVAA